jgi:PadR family transcriptional regulator PadR
MGRLYQPNSDQTDRFALRAFRDLTNVSRSLLTLTPTPVYSMPVANRPMTKSTARDLFPGALEMMILQSLRRQPAHGYALVQHIQQRSNNLLQVEEGSLYPALQRLLKADLVKARWDVSSTNRRVRIYQITASGLRRLEQEISSFERMFEGISLVLNPEKSTAT